MSGKVEKVPLVDIETQVGTSGTNTSGTSARPATDVNQIARSKDTSLVGKQVNLRDVTVGTTSDRGFWITSADGQRIFVMPETKKPMKPGEKATVGGIVLEMPEGLRVELKAPAEQVYEYANRVTTGCTGECRGVSPVARARARTAAGWLNNVARRRADRLATPHAKQ